MGYSIHVPLPGGKLKIKSRNRLRSRELNGDVPTLRIFDVYFVWEAKAKPPDKRAPGAGG